MERAPVCMRRLWVHEGHASSVSGRTSSGVDGGGAAIQGLNGGREAVHRAARQRVRGVEDAHSAAAQGRGGGGGGADGAAGGALGDAVGVGAGAGGGEAVAAHVAQLEGQRGEGACEEVVVDGQGLELHRHAWQHARQVVATHTPACRGAGGMAGRE
ncbi:unnamed protein product [Closterium sp. Naga37s-1]|nr:unnamed protein product [Closterium sp. Naga37s-1]